MKTMKEVNKTEDKINFILPDFLNYDACAYHLSTCRNHPEIFKDNLNHDYQKKTRVIL